MAFLDALRAFFSPPPTVQRGLTFQQLWNTGQQEWNSVTAGVPVTTESALRLIAVQSAIRLLTNDIGSLPVDAFRTGENGKKELRRPSWVVEPNPLNPNDTWEDHVKQVVFSMLSDGNAFVRCFPSVFNPSGIEALDPTSVDIDTFRGATIYKVKGSEDLSPAEIIHLPWVKRPGKSRGLNPIEAAKQGIGVGLAADEFVGSYFGNGAILSGIIEFPLGVEPDEAKVRGLKDDFSRKHVGSRKSHAVGALTGGATFKPFDYNNRDAQLLELRQDIVEEVARLFGIPPHMLGSQRPGAVSYASVEQRSIDYVTHAVLPIVRRIEVGYSRLLRGSQTYLRFNLEGLKRGDQNARAVYYQAMLSGKVIRREEVRALEELPYDPEGVGYLETPNNNPPEPPQEPAPQRTAPDVYLTLPESLDIPAPIVNVPAPIVNFSPPEVHVASPEVTVAAPIVNLPTVEPPQVHVAAPDLAPVTEAVASLRSDLTSLRAEVRKPRRRRLVRNGDGEIIGSDEE